MKKSLRDRIITLRRIAGRLAKDTAGNALIIVAASVVPIAALAGSGIDLSRAYTAQARLQMACDAASLAGRRAMSTGAVDATVRSEALKFFRFNFETGEGGRTPAFNAASFVPVVEDGPNSAVVVRASTTVPTSIMSMFGYTNIPISVSCNARQDFVNTDIVLVLDTTGSMANKAVSSDSQTKIEGIRSAVLALYDELKPAQDQLESVGLRLRYGIVPYSIKVNVGSALRSVDSNYLVSNWTYQSRVANFNTANHTGGTKSAASASTTEVASGVMTRTACSTWGNGSTTTGTPPGTLTITTYSNSAVDNSSSSTTDWGWSSASVKSGTNRSCRRKYTTQTWSGYSTTYSFTDWTYKPVSYDVSNFRSGNTITLTNYTTTIPSTVTVPSSGEYNAQELAAVGSNISTSNKFNDSWDGCIEERDTDSSITSSTTAIDSSKAHDLNIDEMPTNDITRWRPGWSDVIYRRSGTAPASSGTAIASGNYSACPTEAKRLQAWTRSNLNTYLNTLAATGFTYHDIGMIWGAHFISSGGVFAGDNPVTYKNMPVAKYIIYMTDGALQTELDAYTAYGVEELDQRVTAGATSTQDSRHMQRFVLACNAAKSVGANVWVIGFASTLSTQLTNCASKPSQAKVSASSAALIQDFAKIGKEIGALRLTK